MSISIKCDVSLSKKLRAILKGVQRFSIIVSDIEDGRGSGLLSLSSDDGIAINEEDIMDIGETSIMVTPNGLSNEPNGLSNELEEIDMGSVGAIFSSDMSEISSRTAIDRLAATKIPEKNDVPYAIVTKKEIETPKEFKEVDIPSCRKYIRNMSDLIQSINKAKQKPRAQLDLSSAQNDRQKAVMIAEAQQAEGIDDPAWIVNDQVASLTINDLDLDLNLNAPQSLGGIPASKLALSSDLKSVINSGLAKFISPEEIVSYIDSEDSEVEKMPSLEVFSSPKAAELNMLADTTIDEHDGEIIDMNEETLDKPSEEESAIINLTGSMPKEKLTNGSIKTVHGTRPSSNKQRIGATPATPDTTSSKPQVKSIRKLD